MPYVFFQHDVNNWCLRALFCLKGKPIGDVYRTCKRLRILTYDNESVLLMGNKDAPSLNQVG